MSLAGEHKQCCRCGTAKPTGDFTRDKRRADGLRSYCKACERASKARQRTERQEAISASNKRYWKRNARRINKRRRIRYAIAIRAGQMPVWRIGETVHLSTSTVNEWAQRFGISLAFYKPRWTDDDDAELLSLRRQGLTQKAISERTGRSLEAVKAQLRKLRSQSPTN